MMPVSYPRNSFTSFSTPSRKAKPRTAFPSTLRPLHLFKIRLGTRIWAPVWFIRLSSPPADAPVQFAKADGSHRFCADYRGLNEMKIKKTGTPSPWSKKPSPGSRQRSGIRNWASGTVFTTVSPRARSGKPRSGHDMDTSNTKPYLLARKMRRRVSNTSSTTLSATSWTAV